MKFDIKNFRVKLLLKQVIDECIFFYFEFKEEFCFYMLLEIQLKDVMISEDREVSCFNFFLFGVGKYFYGKFCREVIVVCQYWNLYKNGY